MRQWVSSIRIAAALGFLCQFPNLSAATAAESNVTSQTGWLKVPIQGRDFRLAVHIFRPSGPGPFPLVVINHGIPVSASDARKTKLGFSIASAWFAEHGYLVVVPLRPGFGESDGPFLETAGACANRDYIHEAQTTAAIESAIVQTASQLPGVDPTTIVVVGQSAGGFGAIALADEPPPGVIAIISFAGGRGGDDHEHICRGAQVLAHAAGTLGTTNRLPQLWLYADNDHFFPPTVAHLMFEAYQATSKPTIQFVDLPSFDGDGHRTLGYADPSVWENPVSAFLAEAIKGCTACASASATAP